MWSNIEKKKINKNGILVGDLVRGLWYVNIVCYDWLIGKTNFSMVYQYTTVTPHTIILFQFRSLYIKPCLADHHFHFIT